MSAGASSSDGWELDKCLEVALELARRAGKVKVILQSLWYYVDLCSKV